MKAHSQAFFSLFNDHPERVRFKITGLFILLIGANLAAWVWTWVMFLGHPVLLGLALLAYLFGLRHAVDPDHIAAIDNIVRKLSNQKLKPLTTGLFFSMGHSMVVILMALMIAEVASFLKQYSRAGDIAGTLSTCISAFFLFFIAFSNVLILKTTWKAFVKAQRGGKVGEDELNKVLAGTGFLTRFLRSIFNFVSKSHHMFWIGFLFGLGFDTVTEIGLFGLSANQATHGLPLASILVFPILFTAGMALVDTADSILMVQVYGWAFLNPVRKLWYNLTLTSLSILVAFLVGGIEFLSLLAGQLKLSGGLWDLVNNLNDHWNLIGFGIVGLFVAGWFFSFLWYQVRKQEVGLLKAQRVDLE